MYEDKFDSFSAFVEKAETGQSEMDDSYRSSRDSYCDNWAGGSWLECLNLAKYGWQAGAEKVEAMAKPLLEQISSRMVKPEIVFDIEGDNVDIGAYMTGNPECFIRWQDTETHSNASGRFVHVICNVVASAYFSTEQLFNKGAAVAVMVDALEMSGHRVTVDVICNIGPTYSRFGSHDENSNSYLMTARIKNPDDPLNMESIAFACAHSGTLRRLVFSLEEQAPDYIRRALSVGHGYGQPIDPRENLDCDIYVAGSDSSMIRNPLAWAKEQLIAQGVQFTE